MASYNPNIVVFPPDDSDDDSDTPSYETNFQEDTKFLCTNKFHWTEACPSYMPISTQRDTSNDGAKVPVKLKNEEIVFYVDAFKNIKVDSSMHLTDMDSLVYFSDVQIASAGIPRKKLKKISHGYIGVSVQDIPFIGPTKYFDDTETSARTWVPKYLLAPESAWIKERQLTAAKLVLSKALQKESPASFLTYMQYTWVALNFFQDIAEAKDMGSDDYLLTPEEASFLEDALAVLIITRSSLIAKSDLLDEYIKRAPLTPQEVESVGKELKRLWESPKRKPVLMEVPWTYSESEQKDIILRCELGEYKEYLTKSYDEVNRHSLCLNMASL